MTLRPRIVGVWFCAALVACAGAAAVEESSAEEEHTLLGPGEAHYWRAEYDSARLVWGAALERARADGDSLSSAHLLTWLGLAAMRSGDYATARLEGEAALELKLALGHEQELARSYNALGLLAKDEVRLVAALQLFERATAAAHAVGDRRAVATAAGNMGLIHAYLGDLQRAAVLLNEMRDVSVALGETRLEANALTNLAMVSVWSGDPQSALAPLATARRLYREVDYPLGEQYAFAHLATALSDMGRFQDAFATLDSALVLARRHGLKDQEAENQRILGSLFADLGDTRRALRHYDAAAALARELGMHSELGSIHRRAATAHLSLGSIARARADATAALAAHRATGEQFEELADLLVLAEIQQEAEGGAAAASTLRSARLLAQRLDARSALTSVALAEARHAQSEGLPRQVLQAVALARAASLDADSRSRAEIHGLSARAYAQLGRMDSAATEGVAAVTALDRVRGGLTSADLRGSFTAASSHVYGDVVLILLQMGRTEDAFAVADAARSRELLHRLSGVRPAAESGDSISDPLAAAREFGAAELLLRRIDALLSQLREMESIDPEERGAGAEATVGDIQSRIASLRDEYELFAIQTARSEHRSAAVLGAARADGARLRAALTPDEALLHYTVTRDRLVVFVGRRDRFEAIQVAIGAEDLASRIRLLRELWGARGKAIDPGLPVAQALHEILLAPAMRTGLLDGAARLLIVPHGVIEQLPFAALRDPGTGRFLIEDYVIAHAPSANAVPALRRGGRMSSQLSGVHAFAPFPAALRGTGPEASAAAGSQRGGRVYADRRATESAVRRALASGAVVHVATHGIMNARNPMFSRIELARGSGAGSADDGRLEVHEVLQLNVTSPLVVLSGCETAVAEGWSGEPLRPGGVASLAQAFLQAGARNVLATIWRIDDIGSGALLSRFYGVSDQGDVADALARAQRAMIRDAQYAAPYYWAGFVLSGDSRVRLPAQASAAVSVK